MESIAWKHRASAEVGRGIRSIHGKHLVELGDRLVEPLLLHEAIGCFVGGTEVRFVLSSWVESITAEITDEITVERRSRQSRTVESPSRVAKQIVLPQQTLR